MKKRLLLGTALLAAVSAFPQSGRKISQTAGVADYAAERAQLRQIGANEAKAISPLVGSGQTNINYMRPSQPTQMTWDLLCGSMNTYGMIVSSSRPLQYNPNVNAVSFIHRKSQSYVTSPVLPTAAQAGGIVAEISTDWGNTWDSTAIWVDANNWGRYPQGGIYAPPATSFTNAHVVGTGPTVSGSLWTGNWYASKQLNTFSNSQSSVPGAAQFISFAPTNTAIASHGWSRNGFSSTDDGLVRSIGVVEDDLQGLSTVRGFAVSTGTFNNGIFDWSTDTLIPATKINPSGNKYLNPDPQMAFNQAGTIGYVVAVGADVNGTLSNSGMQPIVWKMDKTTSSAATWTQVPSIDFNNNMFPMVTDHLAFGIGQFGDTLSIPFVTDYDITVDQNGKLHLGVLFMSGATDHPDSLNYYAQWSGTTHNNPGELYKWNHSPGNRPYLYDFITDGASGWKCITVDSIASEGPAATVGYPGYVENPWDNTGEGGAKINMDTRIQLGRTPAGDYLTYAWVESDSAITNGQLKWNNMPNIKVRSMKLHANGTYSLDLGPEQNMTAGDPDVFTRATLHYMSPTTSAATVVAQSTLSTIVDYRTPMTVTNSNPYSQLTNNTTWYGRGVATFTFSSPLDVSVGQHTMVDLVSHLYPNPASGYAMFSTVSNHAGTFEFNVMNSVGQIVKSFSAPATAGENKVKVDLTGLSEGIYFVKVSTGSQSTTKKLVVR